LLKNAKKSQKTHGFFLPILPNRYSLTHRTTFSAQNQTSTPKIPQNLTPNFAVFSKFWISQNQIRFLTKEKPTQRI